MPALDSHVDRMEQGWAISFALGTDMSVVFKLFEKGSFSINYTLIGNICFEYN
jgi:hypothetical protein